MKVRWAEIPEEGTYITFTRSDFPWEGLKDLTVDNGPSGHVWVQKQGRDVILRGKVHATFRLACSRCLAGFRYPLEAAITQVLYPLQGGRALAKEIELAPTDLDYETYDGETVELDRLVEEPLLLSLPMQPLCREDCRGLCPRCGADLNEQDCSCPGGAQASPFDCLKEFVVKGK